jgi:hypothetical protein
MGAAATMVMTWPFNSKRSLLGHSYGSHFAFEADWLCVFVGDVGLFWRKGGFFGFGFDLFAFCLGLFDVLRLIDVALDRVPESRTAAG